MFDSVRHNRTVGNVLLSVAAKLAASVAAIISVPILLKIMGVDSYGTWVTLTSMLTWLTIFDFGMGYGLKNEVTRQLAVNENEELEHTVLGCLQFSILVSLVLAVVFLFALRWVPILRGNGWTALCLYVPYILTFPLTISISVLQGARKVGFQSVLGSVGSMYWLLVLLMIRSGSFHPGTEQLALLFAGSFVIQNVLNYYFSTKIIDYRLKDVFSFRHITGSMKILSVGMRFLLLQIASIILFSIGNYLVYTNLSAADAALFDSVNKIFLFGMSLFNMAVSVFWPEFTHSIRLQDRARTTRLFVALTGIAVVFSAGAIAGSYAVPAIITYWTKGALQVSVRQVLPFALLVSIQSLAYCGAVILNVVEAVRGQIVAAVIAALLMVPVANYLLMNGVGIGSIPLASALLTVPSLVYCLYSGVKIIRGVSHGA